MTAAAVVGASLGAPGSLECCRSPVPVPASYVAVGDLRIHPALARCVEEAVCPGTGFSPAYFWSSLARLDQELRPQLEECLAKRDELQARVDAFYEARVRTPSALEDPRHCEESHAFLQEIGYLEPDGGPVSVTTQFVDPEIAQVSAPQLVVPVDNARYMLNAVNARWGSLYGALFGFDVLPDTAMLARGRGGAGANNPVRVEAVVEFGNRLLDEIAPLAWGAWSDAVRLWPTFVGSTQQLEVLLKSGSTTSLKKPSRFVGSSGYLGPPNATAPGKVGEARVPSVGDKGRVYLQHHGLHFVLVIDRGSPVGSISDSGIGDIVLESALTAILDMEDSVATVDAEDKAKVYSNICGIFRGTLTAPTESGERRLEQDIWLRDVNGRALTLPGRAICIVRNVGHHLFTDSALTANGLLMPEGFLDCLVTVAASLHDLRGTGRCYNSRTGSIYIVKPKMHGTQEVALTLRLFGLVEELFGLKRNTIKLGILDEERRTSLNLRECIRAASQRVFFINSGFMDRTGDEIHTCMLGGPVVRKADMMLQSWFSAYENSNVEIGLLSGFQGRGQISKGMWRKPDSMKAMLESKITEVMSGANAAWVPNPAAATLHSIHYHRVDVQARQMQIAMRPPSSIQGMLEPPFLKESLPKEAILEELRENAQSILGYVVRWVDSGVGCSKVPDLYSVSLMEDCATLRISSQLLANWLQHSLISEDELRDAFREVAALVDRQLGEMFADYRPMTPDLDANTAFQTALKLVMQGRSTPNGYPERILREARRLVKAAGPRARL